MLTLIAGGGLGNQLFQYAAARAQAIRLGVDLEIDTRFYIRENDGKPKGFWLDRLPIAAFVKRYPQTGRRSAHSLFQRVKRKVYDERRFTIYREPGLGFYADFLDIKDDTIVYGLFQSYRYFIDCIDVIRIETCLAPLTQDTLLDVDPSCHYAIHVRRSDYLSLHQFRMRDAERYYEEAIARVRQDVPEAKFLVFSDDPQWCSSQRVFQDSCLIYEDPSTSDGADLSIMSQCKGHIIANSSFSLWAALIHDSPEKLVIAPRVWIGGHTTRDLELIKPNWITL